MACALSAGLSEIGQTSDMTSSVARRRIGGMEHGGGRCER